MDTALQDDIGRKQMSPEHRLNLSYDGAGRIPEYTGWVDESLSWKRSCYVGDWSFLQELHVTGPDALRLFSEFAVNSFAKFAIGQAKHAIFCSQEGKVIGEGVLLRRAENAFELNAGGPVTVWLKWQFEKRGYAGSAELKVRDTKFQVSGPKALFALEDLAGASLRDIKFMHFAPFKVAGVDVDFLRMGMAGEIGFELHGPRTHQQQIYDAILAAGRKYDMRRMGNRVRMINHLEAGFPTGHQDYLPAITGEAEREWFEEHGNRLVRPDAGSSDSGRTAFDALKIKGSFDAEDISAWYRSPVELGWTRNIKFDHDFWGREALEKEVADPRRKIVSLVWNTEDVMDVFASLFRDEEPYDLMELPREPARSMYANHVLIGDKRVGVATSRGYSLYFRKMLSHCVIDIEHAVEGSEVEVLWGDPGHREKRVRAIIGQYPFKTDNRRTDLSAVST